jgi:predicted ribosome quality control (RQC) complex YloA/Tae2 family protein
MANENDSKKMTKEELVSKNSSLVEANETLSKKLLEKDLELEGLKNDYYEDIESAKEALEEAEILSSKKDAEIKALGKKIDSLEKSNRAFKARADKLSGKSNIIQH